jgi:hypothetical protein
MGKKKEALKNELAMTRRSVEQLESENQHLRQQLIDGTPAPPFRLITDAKPTPVRAQIAIALGIDPATYQGGVTDEMILEAVERLRNPHMHDSPGDALVVDKKDSLAEAIQHNRAERSTLEGALARSRNIVNRLAGSLQVGQWNEDGDELVEKAQRFGVFWHWLRKRLREHEGSLEASAAAVGTSNFADIGVVVHGELVKECRLILAALIGDKELARILQNKPAKVSKTVLDLAENPAPTGNLYLDRPFDGEDVLWIRDALRKLAGPHSSKRIDQLMLVFERMVPSTAATAEFVSWMNAVVLPVLRKQHPHYATVPKEN